jgi:hypothetical protein
MYTAYPPRSFVSTEYEKREVDKAGPMARAMEPVVCERPLVAPKDLLLGAAEVVNMNIVPHAKSKGGNMAKSIAIDNHTCGECWPKRRAHALINGKDKNTGMNRDIEQMKTFLSPKQWTMRAKKKAWNTAPATPYIPMIYPMEGGSKFRPPMWRGMARKSGNKAQKEICRKDSVT